MVGPVDADQADDSCRERWGHWGRGEPGPPLQTSPLLASPGAMAFHEPSATLSYPSFPEKILLPTSPQELLITFLAARLATQGSFSLAYLTFLLPSSWLPWLSTALRIKFKCLNLALKAFHYRHPEVLLSFTSNVPRSLFQAALPAFCPRQSHYSFFGASPALVSPFSPSLCLLCLLYLPSLAPGVRPLQIPSITQDRIGSPGYIWQLKETNPPLPAPSQGPPCHTHFSPRLTHLSVPHY